MTGEVAIKKMNFLPVILFQALPIPVSRETMKNVQPRVKRLAVDPAAYLRASRGTPAGLSWA